MIEPHGTEYPVILIDNCHAILLEPVSMYSKFSDKMLGYISVYNRPCQDAVDHAYQSRYYIF